MIATFLKNILGAYRAPRLSARWILARAPSLQDCLLMVILASVIQSAFTVLLGLLTQGEALDAGASLGMRMTELVLQLVLYVVLTMGAYGVGKRFGGIATPQQMAAVVSWHYLVTAFLAPLNLLAAQGVRASDENGGSALILLIPISVAISIWIFACFVAEAHGFRRIGGVVAASVAGFLALGVFTMFLATLFSGVLPG